MVHGRKRTNGATYPRDGGREGAGPGQDATSDRWVTRTLPGRWLQVTLSCAASLALSCLLIALGVAPQARPASALTPAAPAMAGARAPLFTPSLVKAGAAGTNAVVVGRRGLQPVSRYLFGANLLWASNAEGAFDPLSGKFWPGFVAAVRRARVTALRYPGGETSDSFQWERAIGPAEHRLPVTPYGMQMGALSSQCCVLDSPQRPTVGPDEFGRLLEHIGAIGDVTVNFASGTAQQAADFVAYMTAPYKASGPGGTMKRFPPTSPSYWAAMRAANGHRAPYPVPYWEVGNEQFFPGQYGWRSGSVLSIGPHRGYCATDVVPECLYAFGGTTAFWDETVGRVADQRPSASYSNGQPGQSFYVYFPPVVPGSATVYVNGQAWTRVQELSAHGPRARVYSLDPLTGHIRFGDGVHGAVPPAGAEVTASYDSGPHGGFVEFYRAMKRMSPKIRICASEGMDLAFLQLMGQAYPYDCLALHEYARPADILAPLPQYERSLMGFPVGQAAQLRQLQNWALHYSHRHVPVVLTEYGQLVAPVPAADPAFNLSLYESLYLSAQLVEWADNGVPLAEKYLLDSPGLGAVASTSVRLASALEPRTAAARRLQRLHRALETGRALVLSGMSPNSALITHLGPRFVTEPTGQALSLMATFAGTHRLPVTLWQPRGRARPEMSVGTLWALAGRAGPGRADIAVVNASTDHAWRARVALAWLSPRLEVSASVLDGPSAAAFNTPHHPNRVRISHWSGTAPGSFYVTFPAHSLTVLRVSPLHSGLLAAVAP